MVLGLFTESSPPEANTNGTLLTYHDCVWMSAAEDSPYPVGTTLHSVIMNLDMCLLLIQQNERDLVAVYQITTATKTVVEGFTPTKRRKTSTPPAEIPPKLTALISAASRTDEFLRYQKPTADVQNLGTKTHALLEAEQVMAKTHVPANGVLEQLSLDALSDLRNTAALTSANGAAALAKANVTATFARANVTAAAAAACLGNDDYFVIRLQPFP